jgi:DNA replication and repair protein RecF
MMSMLGAAQEGRQTLGTPASARCGGRVAVTRLVLTDFRNYRSARLDLGPAPVVLSGPNGAGKTNLLEAISSLSPGRGLRNARLGDIDRRDGDRRDGDRRDGHHRDGHHRDAAASPGGVGWTVAATVAIGSGPVRIGTGRDAAAAGPQATGWPRGERRAIRIDGEPARSQSALAERLGILWLTPQMDRLFIEGPESRRRFMDRLVLGLDPAHASRVGRYEQAMRERSRLLRDGHNDPAWLGALEDIMAAEGVAVAAARRDAIERLDRICAAAPGVFPHARVSVAGVVEAWLGEMPALAAEERLRGVLADARSSDAASGGAANGPHRSDLAVVHAEKRVPAELASTGEQKALLVSIVLAQARLQRLDRGEAPILLLDEVAAHLDAPRRAALFDVIAGLDGQSWITGTDIGLFGPLRGTARCLSVQDGTLSEADF